MLTAVGLLEAIRIRGLAMEKVSLPFYYHLGSQLGQLAELPPSSTPKITILVTAYRCRESLSALLDGVPSLTVCRRVGEELRALIAGLHQFKQPEGFDWDKPPEWPEAVFGNVITKAKEFEIVLSAELQNIPTYHPARKGAYDTSLLIETAELVLPKSILLKLGEDVIAELRQSGQCLAFDIPTASGFHMMRAVEAVLHQYYLAVCKPKDKKKHLDNWGAYIAALRAVNNPAVTHPDVKEVDALLQQLKDRHRNLIMHPEVVLTTEEAFTLFEVGQAAIIAMAARLPSRRAKKTAKKAA